MEGENEREGRQRAETLLKNSTKLNNRKLTCIIKYEYEKQQMFYLKIK